MKKLLIMILMAAMAGFTACDAKTGGNTAAGGDPNAEQLGGSDNGIVNENQNDTTGASATEKTQTSVGNSETRGEQNTSNSETTKDSVIQ